LHLPQPDSDLAAGVLNRLRSIDKAWLASLALAMTSSCETWLGLRLRSP
jgi:hypothetical protein